MCEKGAAINTLAFPHNATGAVFTPVHWALWALERFDIVSDIEAGASLCDPSAGEGNLIIALALRYVRKYGEIPLAVLKRLFLIEKEQYFLRRFQEKFHHEFNRDFPADNIICADIIRNNPKLRFDFLFGNPPWANFCDLGGALKEQLKPYFVEMNLVPDMRNVLLGGARIDIAALVLYSVFRHNVNRHARCGFFLPLSLFLNDGAHQSFRRYQTGGTVFSLDRVYDFAGTEVFQDISTRFCFAEFTLNRQTVFPVEYYVAASGAPRENWTKKFASPVSGPDSPLLVRDTPEAIQIPRISVEEWQQPRQGVNTCGANEVYIFDEFPRSLPAAYVFPLITAGVLQGKTREPEKWILLPYRRDGKILNHGELEEAGLYEYFQRHRQRLENRKGVLLRSALNRGLWWALLGVGAYNFTACKVVWQAYGKKVFSPLVLSNWRSAEWQANQAMHAFIPAADEADATRIQQELIHKRVEDYLRNQRMEETRNWAQPGRIKRFLAIK
ncbi:MAG: hypothetical protein LBK13_04315 [Spirochaetales bacterium]|jgi:hypothetical protein|nr:hypothetical protein [Spirochaetales bacterium]